MAVPNIFASATNAIPLSQLDQNFATAITLGNTAIYLGNTTTAVGNLTLNNVTIASGTNNIAANVSTATGTLPEANGGTGTNTGYYSFKSRIINGAMVIDQRNAGASVTATSTGSFAYTLDRFSYRATAASKFTVQQNAGSVTPPTGFINYLGVTSSSAYSVSASDFFAICQLIEGLNIADFGWGTANAVPITLSFKVYSSLTGTFGGSISNNGFARSYPFSYTISSANTWTSISVTIPGDTSGTWLTTNGVGMFVNFGIGVGSTNSGTAGAWASAQYFAPTGAVSVVGTNAATWYVTGVQLEKGSTATSFDYRSYGTELALCQRYFCKTFDMGTAPANNASTSGAFMLGGLSTGNYEPSVTWRFPVEMRSTPSITLYNPETGTTAQWSGGSGNVSANARALFIGTSSTVLDNTDTTITGSISWRIQATSSSEL